MLAAGLAPATEPTGPIEHSGPVPRRANEDVSRIGDRGVGNGVNFYSLEKEIALGRQLAGEIEKTAKIVDDPVISEYVNRIGQNIVGNSDARVSFTIKVLDADEVNAFALPGSFFCVNTALIEMAEDEAELAGVMAHEIAHVAARHGTRNATGGQLMQYASIPLLFIGGWAGYGIQQAANFAVPMTMLRFSREFEGQADVLGVQYLYKAGYDPASIMQFFERLKARQKKNFRAWAFSSPPMTKSRIKSVQKVIDELLPERAAYADSTSEFNVVKDRVKALNANRKATGRAPNRPTLKRAVNDEPILPDDPGSDQDEPGERPTLTRRQVAD